MVNIIFDQIEQDQLSSMGVQAVILFGSQAQGIAHPDSDYDFLIIGKYSVSTYDKLYDLLSSKINKLVDIDIVFAQNSPMELQNHVAQFGQVLFESKSGIFADFKQQVMLTYSDFAPYREMFNQSILAQI